MAIKDEKKVSKLISCEYSSHTSCHFQFNKVEYNLHKGEKYDLPADCETVQNLISQQRLTIIQTASAPVEDKK